MFILNENDGLNGYDDDGLNAGLNKFRLKFPKIKIPVAQIAKKNIRLKNVNLKNAIKVGTFAANFVPGGQAVGVGSKILKAGKLAKLASKAGKLSKLAKIGKLAVKAKGLLNTQVGQIVLNKVKQGIALKANEAQFVEQVAVAQDQDPTTPNVLTPQEFNEATANQPNVVQANAPMVTDAPVSNPRQLTPAQAQTIAEVKGVDPEVTNTPTKEQVETISKLKDIPAENLKEEVKNQLEDTAKGASSDLPAGSGKTDDTTKTAISPVMIGAGVLLAGGLIYAVSK
ncbi:MAG: hypothetical protein K2P85_01875 [Flavobacteriaceae bacterium]|nr:hypothetical protein [Flavobacteriaceae bacterium]